jgi:hypothetical protein
VVRRCCGNRAGKPALFLHGGPKRKLDFGRRDASRPQHKA